jgi:Na+-translocating ferredoxin:NAD+ oxidoreductase RNF subunit RnfB
VDDRYCQAGVCKGLFQYIILPESCNGCTLCAKACSTGAIQGKLKEVHTLDATLCTQCHACVEVCARRAIVAVPVSIDQQHFQMSEVFS